jgi:type I pantothenate kinase
MDVSDASAVLVSAFAEMKASTRRSPLVVGLSGAVAVGKSTLAQRMRIAAAEQHGWRVTIVGTDGFLFPNRILAEHGLLETKGAPNTYDEDALRATIAVIRGGAEFVEVPTYSHRTFDVDPGEPVVIGDVVVIEGVNALQPTLVGSYDMAVYLDADEDVIVGWFVDRFLGMVLAAETDDESFYRRFVPLDAPGRVSMARSVWTQINAPNLHRFVAPTKAHADLVVRLDAMHRAVAVTRHSSLQ